VTETCVETLQQLQHMMQLNPESEIKCHVKRLKSFYLFKTLRHTHHAATAVCNKVLRSCDPAL